MISIIRLGLCLFLAITYFINPVKGQYKGLVSPITNGYGAHGNYEVAVRNMSNEHYYSKDISVFYPKDDDKPVPVIFFSHGYGGVDTAYYQETLHHIASKGYAVVFVPYKTFGLITIEDRYKTLYDGFKKAVNNMSSVLDPSRVGFYGHSFGGGATPGIAYKAFTDLNWGKNGKFIYCDAPWYSYWLPDNNLNNYPEDCNALFLVYDDDTINDHKMAMDVFQNIAISKQNKDFIKAYSNTVEGYTYNADHSLPTQYSPSESSVFNALDYYIKFRLLDALADYTFTGNSTAKNIALGNGSKEQVNMNDSLASLEVSDSPSPAYPESRYTNPCDDNKNPRRDECGTLTTMNNEMSSSRLKIYPNPASSHIHINITGGNKKLRAVLYDTKGNILKKKFLSSNHIMNVETLKPGLYFLNLNTGDHTYKKSIIIKGN